MSEVTSARIGLLVDSIDECVVRAVRELPKGSFRAGRDAFVELVERDSLVICGP